MIREYSIYNTLKALSKQRVALVLQPGGVWVIECAIPNTESNEENLHTCYMRGWIEPISNAIPKWELSPDGGLPPGYITKGPVYRLTDSGWNAIHRTHSLFILGVILSLLALGVVALPFILS